MPKFIQPDLPFPTRSPIAAPNIGDRIVEIDNARSIRREGIFKREVQYLGTTFWEVESGDTFLPVVCEITKENKQ